MTVLERFFRRTQPRLYIWPRSEMGKYYHLNRTESRPWGIANRPFCTGSTIGNGKVGNLKDVPSWRTLCPRCAERSLA